MRSTHFLNEILLIALLFSFCRLYLSPVSICQLRRILFSFCKICAALFSVLIKELQDHISINFPWTLNGLQSLLKDFMYIVQVELMPNIVIRQRWKIASTLSSDDIKRASTAIYELATSVLRSLLI